MTKPVLPVNENRTGRKKQECKKAAGFRRRLIRRMEHGQRQQTEKPGIFMHYDS